MSRAEHVHRCLNCTPDMVPSYSEDDERYHDGKVCGVTYTYTFDGSPGGYCTGAFEGPDGWILYAGARPEDVHVCPTCCPDNLELRDARGPLAHSDVCIEPRFGSVVVIHGCPGHEQRRKAAALRRWTERHRGEAQ